MSQWGNRDSIDIASVSVTNASNAVVSTTLDFSTANIDAGDTIFLANVAYKVKSVVDTGNIVLDVAYEGSTATVAARIQQSPKDLTTYGWGNVTTGANTVNARNVFGVDRVEINVPENKARGISHTGWVHHKSYTNTQGSLRNHSEVLVAMSKNFNANATGVLNFADSYDDSTVADLYLVFSTQPTDQSALEGNSVVFGSTAGSVPTGATISYQWYESTDGETFAVVNDGGDYSGNTTNTLTISEVANVDGNSYRLVISTTDGGADSLTSDTVTATQL